MSSLAEIKKQLTDEWMSNPEVQAKFGFVAGASFDSVFAPASMVNIIFLYCGVRFWLTQKGVEDSKGEIENIIATMKPHSIRWYIQKIKSFQLGDVLVDDEDYYEEIDETKQVVKYCNISEKNGYMAIKIAGQDANDKPKKLDAPVVTAIGSYINKVKDAGVHYDLICRDADNFRASLRIYYDAQILNSSGERVDGTDSTPVEKAIVAYIESMPFDARYSNMALVDALQSVEGINVVDVVLAEAQYGNNPWVTINSLYIPDAGYMALDSYSVEYIAY